MVLFTLIKRLAYTYLLIGGLFGAVQAIVEGPFTVFSGCLGWRDFLGIGGDAGSIPGIAVTYLRKMVLWGPDLVDVFSDSRNFLEWLAPNYVEKCGLSR